MPVEITKSILSWSLPARDEGGPVRGGPGGLPRAAGGRTHSPDGGDPTASRLRLHIRRTRPTTLPNTVSCVA